MRAAFLIATALLICGGTPPVAEAQTLARPGWVGSGLTPNIWWRHAFVYAVDGHTGDGLKGIATRIDAMQALGVDAVLLRGLQSGVEAGIDPAAGAMEDFDAVLVAASRHSLRVLVELAPKSASDDVSGVARFWLSRGVAGFRLVAAGDSTAQMRQIRSVARSYVGERIMIGDAALSIAATQIAPAPVPQLADAPSPPRGRRGRRTRSTSTSSDTVSAPVSVPMRVTPRTGDGPQLLLDASIAVSPLEVAAIRTALEKNDAINRAGAGVPMLATKEGAGGGPELAKIVATLLLSTRGGTLIQSGQEGADEGADSLGAWYRQMSVMQHGNTTVRTGANATLNHDAENVVAWLRRPQAVSYKNPAVVFVCNMTDKPVTISLRNDITALRIKGSFLKTLARTDRGMGAMSVDAVKIAPYGVYVGELKY